MSDKRYYRRDWDDDEEDEDNIPDYETEDDSDEDGEDYDEEDEERDDMNAPRGSPDGHMSSKGWFLYIVLSLIPIAGPLLLVVWGFIDRADIERRRWARAALGVYVAAICLGAVVFPKIKDSSVTTDNSGKTEASAEAGKENDTADTSSSSVDKGTKDIDLLLADKRIILQITASEPYSRVSETDSDNGETEAYSSEDGRMIIITCMADLKTPMTSIMTEEAKRDQGNISDYKSALNKKTGFYMASYKTSYKNEDTHEYMIELYGNKGDYITVTSSEKLKIRGIGYTDS